MENFAEVCVKILLPENVWNAFKLVGLATEKDPENIVTELASNGFGALDITLCDMLPEESPIKEKLVLRQLSTSGKDLYRNTIKTEYIGGSSPVDDTLAKRIETLEHQVYEMKLLSH